MEGASGMSVQVCDFQGAASIEHSSGKFSGKEATFSRNYSNSLLPADWVYLWVVGSRQLTVGDGTSAIHATFLTPLTSTISFLMRCGAMLTFPDKTPSPSRGREQIAPIGQFISSQAPGWGCGCLLSAPPIVRRHLKILLTKITK